MITNFVFDVDGTLTPSRQPIDPEFRSWFIDWMQGKNVSFVTGSDYPKTVEQVGPTICNQTYYCFCCCGNSIHVRGKEIRRSNWKLSEEHIERLTELLADSDFPIRTGNHIEQRMGLANFSIVGRNATLEQRHQYVEWDKKTRERLKLNKILNTEFDDLESMIGGETGLDIYAPGKNKAQVRNLLEGPIVFFGDRMDANGNDRPLKDALGEGDQAFAVRDYKETWDLLKRIKYV